MLNPCCFPCCQVRELGACIALHKIIPKNRAQSAISSIVSNIRSSGARVILVFAVEQDAAALFDEVLRYGFKCQLKFMCFCHFKTASYLLFEFRQRLTGIQWLASEAWSTAAVLSTPTKYHHILQGSLGFAIRRAHIPGLQEFLLRLHPTSPEAHDDPFLIPFWEEVFQCSLAKGQGHSVGKPPCTGAEDLRNVTNIYSDVSQLRISYNVYKAVYAIAHALKAMIGCVKGKGPFPLHDCPATENIQPWQVPYH